MHPLVASVVLMCSINSVTHLRGRAASAAVMVLADKASWCYEKREMIEGALRTVRAERPPTALSHLLRNLRYRPVHPDSVSTTFQPFGVEYPVADVITMYGTDAIGPLLIHLATLPHDATDPDVRHERSLAIVCLRIIAAMSPEASKLLTTQVNRMTMAGGAAGVNVAKSLKYIFN